ncbi:DNA polymerase I [Entomomonas asaccharolytica]|uniref:DNA polymerase I n=1 Tax=Entomomonas asaccharolytica TaxID=2785331 RepID=A0A974NG05_9GAMM|nr:DNA polymerase I [Entomomonas asaccharolytica]QQP85697.1 DNA polymerase I [Entomomonas asaccharolytica]
MSQTPLVLVDGSSYLYRAYHALPPLTTSTGIPTGAVKGVLNMLKSLAKQYPNSPIAVVFDAKGGSFRDELYADYKAHRPPMPDDLRVQIEPLHESVKAMGFPLLCVDRVEADDVIGTLALETAKKGRPVVISTGDKDMAQLVNDKITLVNTMTGSTLDPQGVVDKFGVEPKLIIDFLALMGDKSDNIPGVPSVGEKTAVGLIQGLQGGLDTIYANLDKVPSLPIRGAKSLPAKLEEHKDMAYLSYQLATIKTDVELDIKIEELQRKEEDEATLIELYKKLEFRQWLDVLLRKAPKQPSTSTQPVQNDMFGGVEEIKPQSQPQPSEPQSTTRNYQMILEQQDFDKWLAKLQNAQLIAFDTETTSIDAQQAELVGLSFAVKPYQAVYIPVAHDYMGAPQQLSRDKVLAALKPILENANIAKVGQHAKYDMNVLSHYGIDVRGIKFDTMLESYVLDSTASRHDMDTLAQTYLDETTISFEEVAGKGAKQLTFNQVSLEQAAPYAAEDADITLRLHQVLWNKLQQEPSQAKVLTAIEMPLVPVLARIERNGALVDGKLLASQSQELGEKMVALENKAFELAGQNFNMSSPKQLGEILYTKLKLPIISKTAKGQPSTAEAVLAELALQGYDLPEVLMEYRTLSKLKSTYTDRLPEQINPRTGRIHTSYHQAVTATGRLSSSDPNLQNIPIRSQEGRRIRQAFIAPKGYKLLAADYSQIELRIMAHLAQDKGLLEAFKQGLDVHRATAAEVFGVSVENVTSDQRRKAKAINFGLIYGMSAFGLAKQIGVDRKEAQQYIDKYFTKYPGVLAYMERTREAAAEKGYVETLFDRRLYLPDIKSGNANVRRGAERTAINAPMQGTAADIIKRAMVKVDAWLQQDKVDAKVILQVHDELVLEVQQDQLQQVSDKIKVIMAEAAELAVPLVVDVGIGNNWDEAH